MSTSQSGSRFRFLWKAKAKSRRLENKLLKQRIKELTQSRDMWKKKAKDRRAALEGLESELSGIKKRDG